MNADVQKAIDAALVTIGSTGIATASLSGTGITVISGPKGDPGPAGPAGPAGSAGSSVISRVAGATLSGHRVVKASSSTDVVYCDAAVASDAAQALGITLGAASMGGGVLVQTSGEIVEPSWTWTPGQVVYVGAAGALASSTAGLAFQRAVGVAESTTVLNLRLLEPLLLS